MAIILTWQSRVTLDTISNSFDVCRAMLFSTQCQTASMPGSLDIANWYVECYKIAFAILNHIVLMKVSLWRNLFLASMIEMIIQNCSCQPIFAGIGEHKPFQLFQSTFFQVKSTLPMSPDSKKLCFQQYCFKCMIIICWRRSSCSVSHQCCVTTQLVTQLLWMINDQFITLAIDNVWMVQLIFFLGGVNSCTDDLSRSVSLLHQS